MPITNSTTAVQHWLWQSEQFLNWNDGVNLPVFYDGAILRRSNGASLNPIANITGNLTIPEVGEVTSANSSVIIPASYLNQSVLVGTSQFVITKIGGSTVASSVQVNTSVIQLGSASDQLLNTTALVTSILKSSKFCGYIASGGVVQGASTITNWQNILAPVAATGSTPGVAFNISFPANTVFDPNFNKQATFRAMSVGDVIQVNGFNCSVNSVSYLGATNTYLTGANCTPLSSSATGVAISGTVTPAAHSWCVQTNQFGQCTLTVSSNGSSFSGSGSGNMNGGTSGSGAITNYFSVALNAAPDLLTGTQSFQAISTLGTIVSFTGTINGRNLVNCQMSSPPNTSAPVNFVATSPSNINQYVTCSAGSQTSIGTVQTTVNVATAAFNLTASSVVSVGQLLFANPAVNGTQQAYLDYFIVTAVSNVSGSTTNFVELKNQTGTPGNVIQAAAAIIPIPEMPVSTIGVYGKGRNWVCMPDGKSYVGGDLVGSSSGTNISPTNYNYSDAVLKVSQNQFLAGGTTFKVPGAGQKIRAMQFSAQLDASLGDGPLKIFTDENVFDNVAPTDAATWSKIASPIQAESLIGSGGIGQDAVVQSNSDLIFRLSDGGIQSMLSARLDFNKWGNTPISKEVYRAIKDDAPALLPFTSVAKFNQRAFMTCQLAQASRGVYGAALVSLNFDPNSSLEGKQPSIWEGQWTGLNILKIVTGFFNGVKECYALCLSQDLTQIELHQILLDKDGEMDDGNVPITVEIESPMLLFDDPNAKREYKRLVDGDFSFQNISADVQYGVYYRTDQNPNWTLWYVSTIVYQGVNDPGYRRRIPIGEPSPKVFDPTNNQPMREGYNFQIKFTFTGPGQLTVMRIAADIIPEPQFGRPT